MEKHSYTGDSIASLQTSYVRLVHNNSLGLYDLFQNKDIVLLGEDIFGTQQQFIGRLISPNIITHTRWVDQSHDKIMEELYRILFGSLA